MRTKGESLNCQSREKVILCGQHPSPGWCCCRSVPGTWAAPEHKSLCSCCPPASPCRWHKPDASSQFPPAAGPCHRCCTADRAPRAGAAPVALAVAVPGHARCSEPLRTAGLRLGRSGIRTQPGAGTSVPAGLFSNNTSYSVLLLRVLCTAIHCWGVSPAPWCFWMWFMIETGNGQ